MKPASMRRALRGTVLLAALCAATVASAPAQDLETAVQESYTTNLVLLREATRASVAELFIGFSAPEGETLLVEPDGDNPANWYVENNILAHLTQAGYQAYLKEASPRPAPREAEGEAAQGPRARQRQQQQPQESEPASLAEAMKAAGDSTGAGGPAQDASEAGKGASGGASTPAGAASGSEGTRPDFTLRYRVLHFEITYPKNYRTSPLGSRKVQRRVSVSLVASLLRGTRENVVWVGDGAVERLDVVPASKLALLEGSDFPFTQPTLETRGLGSLVEPALVSGIVLGLVYLFYTNQD